MKSLKTIFRFYLNASIHVALSVVSLTVLTCLEYDIYLDLGLLGFVFFSSITGYNFVKYAPIVKLYHRRLTNQLKQIQIFSFLAFVGLCVMIFYVSPVVILVSCFLGIITLLYAVPVGRKNLRETSILKVFIIAIIWAITSFVLPFLKTGAQDVLFMTTAWYLSFVERFLWVVLLMIPFEIRDLKYDQKHLKTLVSVCGVQNIKWISIIILILLVLYKVMFFKAYEIKLYLFIYATLAIVIVFSKSIQKPYFASFWVESLPIFWLLVMFLFSF